jgi:ribonuclease HI
MEKSNTLHIYTDASYSKEKKKDIFGMGAVIVTDDKDYKISIRVTDYYLSDYTDTEGKRKPSIATAEAFMIYEIIKRTSHIRSKTIRIYSDSLFSLESILKPKTRPKHKKSSFYNIITDIRNLIKDLSKDGYKVEFRWVKAHENTYGNEVADVLAKSARNIVPNIQDGYFMEMLGKISIENTMRPYLKSVS